MPPAVVPINKRYGRRLTPSLKRRADVQPRMPSKRQPQSQKVVFRIRSRRESNSQLSGRQPGAYHSGYGSSAQPAADDVTADALTVGVACLPARAPCHAADDGPRSCRTAVLLAFPDHHLSNSARRHAAAVVADGASLLAVRTKTRRPTWRSAQVGRVLPLRRRWQFVLYGVRPPCSAPAPLILPGCRYIGMTACFALNRPASGPIAGFAGALQPPAYWPRPVCRMQWMESGTNDM
jgi:hypothetical protein